MRYDGGYGHKRPAGIGQETNFQIHKRPAGVVRDGDTDSDQPRIFSVICQKPLAASSFRKHPSLIHSNEADTRREYEEASG